MKKNEQKGHYHIPVMVPQVLEYLALKPGGVYIDATFGGGGHTRALLAYDPTIRVIAFDWDKIALEKNGAPLQEEFPNRLHLIWGNFAQLRKKLAKEANVDHVDGILADFGTSQYQLKERAGFSFHNDTPLDMRMSPAHQLTTAAQVVNEADERTLRDIFFNLGEEPKSIAIAKTIIQERKKKQILTTGQLAGLVERVVGYHGKKIHPATKIFQALRIYVNQELENIAHFIPAALSALKVGGRLVCISFHSLEDRIVKQMFKEHALHKEPPVAIVTKRVVTPDVQEVEKNPASRSARLRAAEVIDHKKSI